MDQFSAMLADSAAAVSAEYFQLSVAGSDGVYRERVYCYELYHQMRQRWPSDSHLRLNGEIDKQSHHLLEQLGVHGEKPDFLVHEPGSMDSNYVIIEVKHVGTSARGIRKDLETLRLFKESVGYARALFLVFGFESDENFVRRVEAVVHGGGLPGIELWLHSEVGKPARHLKTLA